MRLVVGLRQHWMEQGIHVAGLTVEYSEEREREYLKERRREKKRRRKEEKKRRREEEKKRRREEEKKRRRVHEYGLPEIHPNCFWDVGTQHRRNQNSVATKTYTSLPSSNATDN